MIDLKKYQQMLAAYQAFEETYWATAFAAEKEKYLTLADDFQGLEKTLNAIVAKESPAFNIFDILNVRQYEEKLHTPFLCHLLNPK